MLKIKKWYKVTISNLNQLDELTENYRKNSSNKVLFFDTETDGLSIKRHKPFLLQVGWVNVDTSEGWVVIIRKKLIKEFMLRFIKEACVTKICGHNIKFDIHMLSNIGCDLLQFKLRFRDTQIMIRAAHDNLPVRFGGPTLKLKDYSSKYIDKDAKNFEHKLKEERKQISKMYNDKLKKSMYAIDRYWTLQNLKDFFKDSLNSADDLPDNVKGVYKDWYNSLPKDIQDNMLLGHVQSTDIPYTLLDQNVVEYYAALDIKYTAEVYIQCFEIAITRKQMEMINREELLIPALVRMESCGFEINKEYVTESVEVVGSYLKQRREDLKNLVGHSISTSQNMLIKELLLTKFNVSADGTGKDELIELIKNLEEEHPAIEFIKTIQELRTLEKWYATYLLRFVREMQFADRIYTQISQVGAVTGRVTSDFQQFPKYGVLKNTGEPLFNPRHMVKTTPGYAGIAYLDYSQIELRIQAMYTILLETPDLNLCRAYMPLHCFMWNNGTKVEFDFKNKELLNKAYTVDWFLNEDPTQKWHPTDVHGATTKVAFPNVVEGSEEFKKLRNKVCKSLNFAKNYGAGIGQVRRMFPQYDEETIKMIDGSYYKAFPGVKEYHSYCYERATYYPYTTNLFGVKYYGQSGHNLCNTLVQGSGAYLLKERIYEVDQYIQKHNLKTRLQMQIHDELSYEVYPGEEHHIEQIQKIMQRWEHKLIPIVADLEFTTTTWAEKKEVEKIG